jgi:hypothetical protein
MSLGWGNTAPLVQEDTTMTTFNFDLDSDFDAELIVEGDCLADLFAQADAIGDKYLTLEEIEERNAKLQGASEEFEANSLD